VDICEFGILEVEEKKIQENDELFSAYPSQKQRQPLVPLLLLGPPFFPIILFGFSTLLTGMTGNSLHMQWPLTSQSHGSVSQREQFFIMDQTPHPPSQKHSIYAIKVRIIYVSKYRCVSPTMIIHMLP
jgi:hypothetical protein